MAEIIEQGEVSILGTVLCTGDSYTIATKVFTIRTYNPSAYVIRLERYNAATTTTEVLFEFSLSAGDTLTDTTTYAVKENDQLILYSDIIGTSYYVYGASYASS
jgi:hypothetical protein